ncbi:hypothetical protein N8A98_22245 [Devosia neptuniae]|uniref:Uncharacterized protein n=1 Tax=Devosia neptuniae TaxID=191302 RepID=A0ABY6CCB7_9HYPH|nr:hypothetical protein [Devosia neptuniae]UXN69894.1 hypothetical protein N8A98_22245 [Devosia neptuniae]
MFTNVILGWFARRALEIGGLIGAALTAWNGLPPVTQDAILLVLGRNWEGITLGALVPIAFSLWGYVWSYMSTVKPQVVTADKEQIPLTRTGAAEAEAVAKLAPRPRTLWERLTQR